MRNTGTTSITAWTVTFTFPNGQTISQVWNGQYTQTGASVTVRNAGWNGNLAPNSATSFGFLASWNGTNGAPTNLTCR